MEYRRFLLFSLIFLTLTKWLIYREWCFSWLWQWFTLLVYTYVRSFFQRHEKVMRFTLKNPRFLQCIDYQNARKTEFLGCQSQEWCFCSVIWPDFTEIIPNFSSGLFRTFPDNVGLPKKSRVQSQSPTGRLRWGEVGEGEGPWQVAVEGKLLNINQKRHPPPSRYDGEEGALIYSFRWSWPPRLRDSVVSF